MTANKPAALYPARRSVLVSVIIPCFKMGRFIGEALASVGRQTYDSWEVIAVDDCGPEDGTREAVEEFASLHPGKRVEYHRLPENQGVSAARNAAIQASRGDLLAFLDPDDWWPADYLAAHVAAHGTSPEVAMTFCRAENADEAGQTLGTCTMPPGTDPDSIRESLYIGNFILPSGTVVKAADFAEIGLFDTDRNLQHLEDWDAWLRLLFAGKTLRYLETTHCYWRRHGSSASIHLPKTHERAVFLRMKHRAVPEFMHATLEHLRDREIDCYYYRLEHSTPFRSLKALIKRAVQSRP